MYKEKEGFIHKRGLQINSNLLRLSQNRIAKVKILQIET